jgi:hypothetical protein
MKSANDLLAVIRERFMRTVHLAGFAALLCLGPIHADQAGPPISPDTYRTLSCKQILQEARAVARRGSALVGSRPNISGSNNDTGTEATVIIDWPTSTNKPDEIAKLRYAENQIDALELASIDSQCSIEFDRLKIRTP